MPASGPGPNVLWICTDQQRYDTVGALGNPHVRTPHLDRLVAEGVAFERAYCQAPICTPSRASFLTGMYPSAIRACGNGNVRWAGAAPLVTRLLADAGYDCGLAGKLHLAAAQGRVERRGDDGYRVFHWSHHPRPDWPEGHAYHEWLTARGFDLDAVDRDNTRIPPELHQTTWCAEMAVEFMEEEREGPWLFSVNPFDPHPPMNPPREIMARYDPESMPGPLFRESDLAAQARLDGVDFQTRAASPGTFDAKVEQAAYHAMIELIDRSVGAMLDALERTGQAENTLVIFTSDHGDALGDHGLRRKGCRFYDGLVRVPLIFRWPDRACAAIRTSALVELTDLAPALLDFAGLPHPARMQGRSLAPILTGEADPSHHRDVVRSEYFSALCAPGRQGFVGSRATMLRDDRYKLVVYHNHPVGELFDMTEDPGEFTNLWDDPAHAEVRCALMKQSFDALADCIDLGPEQVARF